MCEDQSQPAKLLVVTSVTELSSSGKKCCKVNNGKAHIHCIQVENQRREKARIWGKVTTRSVDKQLFFTRGRKEVEEWSVDLLAYGQQISKESIGLVTKDIHSCTEDIQADLRCEYDDPFSTGGSAFSITIPVAL